MRIQTRLVPSVAVVVSGFIALTACVKANVGDGNIKSSTAGKSGSTFGMISRNGSAGNFFIAAGCESRDDFEKLTTAYHSYTGSSPVLDVSALLSSGGSALLSCDFLTQDLENGAIELTEAERQELATGAEEFRQKVGKQATKQVVLKALKGGALTFAAGAVAFGIGLNMPALVSAGPGEGYGQGFDLLAELPTILALSGVGVGMVGTPVITAATGLTEFVSTKGSRDASKQLANEMADEARNVTSLKEDDIKRMESAFKLVIAEYYSKKHGEKDLVTQPANGAANTGVK